MKKLILGIITGLIIGFILCFFIYKSPESEIVTEYRDTAIYINVPETSFVEKVETKYEKFIIDSTDTLIIDSLNKILVMKDSFIKELLTQLDSGKALIIKGGKKFYTGDSVFTVAQFFPLSSIEHEFYPTPDTTFKDCTIVDYKSWLSIIPQLSFTTKRDGVKIGTELGILFSNNLYIGPEIEFEIDSLVNVYKGITVGKKFDIDNPFKKFFQ